MFNFNLSGATLSLGPWWPFRRLKSGNVFSIALLAAFAVALLGCGEKTDDGSASTASTAAPATPPPAKAGANAPGAEGAPQLTDAGANAQAGTKAGG